MSRAPAYNEESARLLQQAISDSRPDPWGVLGSLGVKKGNVAEFLSTRARMDYEYRRASDIAKSFDPSKNPREYDDAAAFRDDEWDRAVGRIFEAVPELRTAYEQELQKEREAYDKQERRAGAKGFADVLTESHWSRFVPFLGTGKNISDLVRVTDAVRRFEHGQATPDDMRMLEDFVRESQTERTFGGQVGEILAEAPAFIGELLSTGGIAAAGSAATKKVLRSRIEKLLAETAKDAALKRAGLQTSRLLARGAEVAAGEATRLIPSGTLRATEYAMRRAIPPGRFENDPESNTTRLILERPLDDWVSNLPAGFFDSYVELLSEQTGGLFKFIPGVSMLDGVSAAVARRWIHRSGGTMGELGARIARRAGWHGVVSEMMEERVGEAMRGGAFAVSDGEFGERYRVPTAKQLAAEAVAFTLTGAGFQLPDIAAEAAVRVGDATRRGVKRIREAGSGAGPDLEAAFDAIEAFSPERAQWRQEAQQAIAEGREPPKRPKPGDRIQTGRPRAMFTFADGSEVYMTEGDASQVAEFRNSRRVSMNDPEAVVEPLFAQESTGYWVVRSQRPSGAREAARRFQREREAGAFSSESQLNPKLGFESQLESQLEPQTPNGVPGSGETRTRGQGSRRRGAGDLAARAGVAPPMDPGVAASLIADRLSEAEEARKALREETDAPRERLVALEKEAADKQEEAEKAIDALEEQFGPEVAADIREEVTKAMDKPLAERGRGKVRAYLPSGPLAYVKGIPDIEARPEADFEDQASDWWESLYLPGRVLDETTKSLRSEPPVGEYQEEPNLEDLPLFKTLEAIYETIRDKGPEAGKEMLDRLRTIGGPSLFFEQDKKKARAKHAKARRKEDGSRTRIIPKWSENDAEETTAGESESAGQGDGGGGSVPGATEPKTDDAGAERGGEGATDKGASRAPLKPVQFMDGDGNLVTVPAWKQGDRVTWKDNKGQVLTGTVGSDYTPTLDDLLVSVNVDQIKRVGGVPIGRIEYVNTLRLKRIEGDNDGQVDDDAPDGGRDSPGGGAGVRGGPSAPGGRSEDAPPAGEKGEKPAAGGRGDGGGSGLPEKEGDSVPPGSASRPGGRAPRARGGRGGAPKRGDSGEGAQTEQSPGPRAENDAPAGLPPRRPKDVADRNHRIGSDDLIAPKSDKGKIEANIEAVRLLVKLEKEKRNATPAEKKVLARYVGWGASGVAPVTDTLRAKRLADSKERIAEYEERLKEWQEKYAQYEYMKPIDPRSNEVWRKNYEDAIKWEEKYAAYQAELLELVGPVGLRSMNESTPFAHYTSKDVITRGIWAAVQRLGFKGGNVLETSAGIGSMIGLQPEKLADISQWTAVEIEDFPARMMAKLYPEAHVINGDFGTADIAPATIDLIVGNVPFAASKMDWEGQPKFSLHNAFMARSLRLLRPDGLMVVITSRSTMDEKASDEFRAWASGKASLVGAIRLPEVAFMENAGTKVTTDILIFQKFGKSGIREDWTHRGTMSVFNRRAGEGEYVIDLNEYFLKHPEQVLGRLVADGLYPDSTELDSTVEHIKGEDWVAKLDAAVQRLPENIGEQGGYERPKVSGSEGTIDLDEDGEPYQVVDGRKVPFTGKKVAFFKGFVPLKKMVLRLFDMQVDPEAKDADIEALRAQLRTAYRAFYKKHGRINAAFRDFESDPDCYRVGSLEHEKQTLATKVQRGKTVRVLESEYFESDLLERRTQYPLLDPPPTDSIEDAAIISEVWKGRIDLDYIGKLTNQSTDAVRKHLLNTGAMFIDPASGELVERADYLSGHVKNKLVEAKSAAETNPAYEPNVKALEAVIPERRPITKTHIRLGASWIPTGAYVDFAQEMADTSRPPLNVIYSEVTRSLVAVPAKSPEPSDIAKGAGSRLKTPDGKIDPRDNVPISEIIAKTINNERIVVMDHWVDEQGNKRSSQNREATASVQFAQKQLQDKFQRWVRSSPKWGLLAEDAFNEKVNVSVARSWEPPAGVTQFPGADPAVSLRPHQARDALRSLRNSHLNAHEVGTGKTYIIISSAMEHRRLGLARKPMIVVQNSTIAGYARSFAALYPSARVLIPSSRDFKKENRKRLLQSIASNDWDAVIIPQSQLEKIKNDPKREFELVADLQDQLEQAIIDEGGDPDNAGRSFDPKVKALARRLKSVKELAAKLLDQDRDDDVLSFEALGVDALFVDEAHAYKKLAFMTAKPPIKGMDTEFSKRGLNMVLKTRFVQEKRGGRNVHFYTGTPITNTVAEAWTMLRYLRPDILRENNIETFDEFVDTFATQSTEYENAGGVMLKPVERLRAYQNVPVMQRIWLQVSDEQTAEDAGIPRPEIADGGRVIREIQPTRRLARHMRRLLADYQRFENMTAKERYLNRHLPGQINNSARAASVDMRLVNPNAPADKASKLNAVADEMAAIYKETASFAGVQVGFLDRFRAIRHEDTGRRKTNPETGEEEIVYREVEAFNAMHALRDALVERGIPREEIEVMTDSRYDNLDNREPVFEAARQGKVRIILASTQRAGVGVNIQDRLAVLHHIDAPPVAADMEQREGRINRQGNETVALSGGTYKPRIICWGVLRSFDSGQYERLARKAFIMRQFRSGHAVGDTLEDDEDVLSYAAASASLTGDTRFKRRADLQERLRVLKEELEQFQQGQLYLQNVAREKRSRAAEHTQTADYFRAIAEGPGAEFAKQPEMVLNGETFSGQEAIKKALKELVEEQQPRIEAQGERGMDRRVHVARVIVNGEQFSLVGYIRLSKAMEVSWGVRLEHKRLTGFGQDFVKSEVGLWNQIEKAMTGNEAVAEKYQTWAKNALQEAEENERKIGGSYENEAEIDKVDAELRALVEELAAETKAKGDTDESGNPIEPELTEEELGEAEPDPREAKKGGGASGGNPAAPARADEGVLERLERLAEGVALRASARLRGASGALPGGNRPGFRRGGEQLTGKALDAAIWLGARLAAGAIKGFRAAKKAIIAKFGAELGKQAQDIYSFARDIASKIAEAPSTTPKEAVKEATKTMTKGNPPLPKKGTNRERKVIAEAYKQGVLAILPALRKLERQIKTIEGHEQHRERALELVERFVPPDIRGKFVRSVLRTTTRSQLRRTLRKMRRELIRAAARQIGKRIAILTHKNATKFLSDTDTVGWFLNGKMVQETPRKIARALRAQAVDPLRRLTKLSGMTKPVEYQQGTYADAAKQRYPGTDTKAKTRRERWAAIQAERAMRRDYDAVILVWMQLEHLHQLARHERAANRQERGEARAQAAERIQREAMQAKLTREDIPTGDFINPESPDTKFKGKVGAWLADLQTFTGLISKTLQRLMYRMGTRVHETYLREVRDRVLEGEQAARRAGFRNIDDALDKLGRTYGEGNTQFIVAVLGGHKVRITMDEALKITSSLEDASTYAELEAGKPIKFAVGREQMPFEADIEELEAIREQIDPKLIRFMDELKAIREKMRPDLFRAFRKLRGHEPDVQEGYEPRSKERSAREERFTLDQIMAVGQAKWLENMGFLKDRTGGGESIVFGGFLTDWIESIENSAKVTHLAEWVRHVASVLATPTLRAQFVNQFGRQSYRVLEDYLMAASLINERIRSPFGRFIHTVNQAVATSKLGLNPGTWARQIGGVFRLWPIMGSRAFRAGVAGAAGIEWETLYKSGYFFDRYHHNFADRMSYLVAGTETKSRASVEFQRAFAAMRAGQPLKALAALRRAAATTLQILNWFDAWASRVAVAGYLAEAKRRFPDRSLAFQEEWALTRAADAIRETQNSSSILDMPYYAVAGKDTAAAAAFLFTSDQAKQRNRIRRAATDGHLAAHMAAELANIVWGVGSSTLAQWSISMIASAVLGGDGDDRQEISAKAWAADRLFVRSLRELSGVFDPLVTPRLIDVAAYSQAGLTDTPFTSSIEDVLAAARKMRSAVKAHIQGKPDTGEKYLLATDALVRDTLGMLGLNPAQSVWRNVSKTAADTWDSEPSPKASAARRSRRTRRSRR